MSATHLPHARSPHKGDGRVHIGEFRGRNLYVAAFKETGEERVQRVRSDGSGRHGRRGPSKGIDEHIEAELKAMGERVAAKPMHMNLSLYDALGVVLGFFKGDGDERGKLEPYHMYTMQEDLNLGVALTASDEVRVSQYTRNSTIHTV